ncbi:VOC family protein [Sphingobium aquiterrae]|uniref:VOC family protein n=1 Tax=Sphingobium aquiterrae TaxID=2038656 RepID=UPI003019F437
MSNPVLERPSNNNDGAPRTIAPTQIAHFVVYTSRFQEMVAFYKQLLGLISSHEDENVAFMTYDEEHHRVAIVNVPDLKDLADGVAGFHHVAFTYASLRDLFETHERLTAVGVKPYWAVNHGPTTSMYFRDPDGNRVEMQVDNFDTAAEGIAYCRLPEFAENPIGVDIDPVEMLARLRNGVPEAELKRRAYIGPRGMADFPRG